LNPEGRVINMILFAFWGAEIPLGLVGIAISAKCALLSLPYRYVNTYSSSFYSVILNYSIICEFR